MIPTMTLSRSGVFYEALSLVFLSELGDKTFFMAGLLAMKTSRWVSFLGSFGALAAMTAISVFIGQLFHAAPLTAVSIPLDKYAAVLAFAFFGFKTIMEAGEGHSNSVSRGNNDVENEQQEAAKTINGTLQNKPVWAQITSAFALVFCAEFGDRSMLATIALGATHNPFRVALGAIAGHGLTTLIAVCGGSYFAKHISEEAVGYFSGALFLLLSLTTALNIF